MIVSSGMRVTPQRFSIATGTVLVSFTSQTVFDVVVNYGFTFAAPPIVMVNIASTGGSQQFFTVRAVSATATGFTLRVWAQSGAAAATWSAVPVKWAAIPA